MSINLKQESVLFTFYKKESHSPYWSWVRDHGGIEPVEVNPESISRSLFTRHFSPRENQLFEIIVSALNNGGLNRLTKRQRLVFQKVYIQSQKITAVAKQLGCDESVVREHLKAGAVKLREFIQKRYDYEQ